MIEGHVKIFYFCEKYIKYSSFGPSILYNFEVSTFGFLGRQLFEQMKVASKRSFEQFESGRSIVSERNSGDPKAKGHRYASHDNLFEFLDWAKNWSA